MRFDVLLLSALAGTTSAVVLPRQRAPALPLSAFNTTTFQGISLAEALSTKGGVQPAPEPNTGFSLLAVCANPEVRVEWDAYPQADKQAFVSAIRCLQGRPRSGVFPQSRNRYEDLVALHQDMTNNVHRNSKFLLWHRYYLWAFQDILRQECGFNRPIPWFDETRYSGRFSQSSVFSAQWFGAIALGGQCVTNGQFAGLTLNVGPGQQNRAHCLARNGNAQTTSNVNTAIVNACNQRTDYASMASCAEGGAHAWGHNGIGAVMSDVYASPGDPVFFLHHAFIDRNFRIWQNANPNRIGNVNGNDAGNVPLTMDTVISLRGIRPDVRVRDVINTFDTHLCYRYNY